MRSAGLGYQAYCVHRVLMGTIGTQSELARIPLADGTLVATPGMPEPDLIPSLMAASDVLGTGWFAAVAAEAGPGKTVAVVGDGAVGLLGVMAAQQLGAERIIAFSRHADRQALAREFGATDIVEERGEAGVARVEELTGGLGAHSVIEAVGTQEAMMQAIHSTRPGGHVGFVGVSHDVAISGDELFMAGVHIHGGPAPVRRFLPKLIQLICDRKIDPGKVLDLTLPLEKAAEGQGDGPAHRHQGPAPPMTARSHTRASFASLSTLALAAALGSCAGEGATRSTADSRTSAEPTSNQRPRPRAPRRATSTPDTEDTMRIRITIGDRRFTATLDDSAAGRDLVAQLPVTIDMVDHGGVEKTGPLPAPLSLDGQPEGADPDIGDVGYYAPGNDLVLYYGDQSYYPGIVVLGQLDDSAPNRSPDWTAPSLRRSRRSELRGPGGLPGARPNGRPHRGRFGAPPLHARRGTGSARDVLCLRPHPQSAPSIPWANRSESHTDGKGTVLEISGSYPAGLPG